MRQKLPSQINNYVTELHGARGRYLTQAADGYDVDWSKGVAMGMALALDFLHTWTHGDHGMPLDSATSREAS